MTADKILSLEVVENGSYISLVANDGTLYATGYTSREMLREAGFIARERGYEDIRIGAQSWEVTRLIALD